MCMPLMGQAVARQRSGRVDRHMEAMPDDLENWGQASCYAMGTACA
jgi:hypothetical protein